MTIEPLVANRLIPLDKGEGAVRPIGVGEVLRRICGKCVMSVVKKDVDVFPYFIYIFLFHYYYYYFFFCFF